MDARWGQNGVPRGLTIEVGMDIDETWGHGQAVSINFAGASAR